MSSSFSKIGIATAFMGVALLAVGSFIATHNEFLSRAVFQSPGSPYGIQVTGMDFERNQANLHLRVIDQTKPRLRDRFEKFLGPDRTMPIANLYVGADRHEQKHLLGVPNLETFKSDHNWIRKDSATEDWLTLTFEPVTYPERENVFKLQFQDFPELHIESQNSIPAYLPLVRSIPPSLFEKLGLFLILLGAFIQARLYLIKNPTHADAIRRAALRLSWEIAHLNDPVEARRSARLDLKQSTNPTPKNPPETSEDEIKMREAIDWIKRDMRYQVDLSAGKKLYAREALLKWGKEQRARFIQDEKLTGKERQTLLDALDLVYDEEEKRIIADTSIYEDD